jgi:nitrogen regulatory protein PII
LRTIEAIAERRHAAEVRRALRDLLRECAVVWELKGAGT